MFSFILINALSTFVGQQEIVLITEFAQLVVQHIITGIEKTLEPKTEKSFSQLQMFENINTHTNKSSHTQNINKTNVNA